MNTLLKHALILAAISLALVVNVHSQPSSDTKMLSGHSKKSEDAIKESTDIVIAVFTTLGSPGADASGENDYDQAEVKVANALKGTLSGELKVFYVVFAMPGKDQESAPVLGMQYIMFIQKLGPTEYEIKKLLPATDDNVAKIKTLIAAASK